MPELKKLFKTSNKEMNALKTLYFRSGCKCLKTESLGHNDLSKNAKESDKFIY